MNVTVKVEVEEAENAREREREDRESEDYERRGLEMSREMELGGRVLNFGRNCSIAISQWSVRISNR